MSHDRTLCQVCENPDQKIVFGGDTVLFLQNEKEQGALLGSGIIIPVRHAETVFDLTPEEVYATFALLQHVKAWMDERYLPDGYIVGWNCGAVGGQLAMPAHLHVRLRKTNPFIRKRCGLKSCHTRESQRRILTESVSPRWEIATSVEGGYCPEGVDT
jgi:histidine triad (HIT) family protein